MVTSYNISGGKKMSQDSRSAERGMETSGRCARHHTCKDYQKNARSDHAPHKRVRILYFRSELGS